MWPSAWSFKHAGARWWQHPWLAHGHVPRFYTTSHWVAEIKDEGFKTTETKNNCRTWGTQCLAKNCTRHCCQAGQRKTWHRPKGAWDWSGASGTWSSIWVGPTAVNALAHICEKNTQSPLFIHARHFVKVELEHCIYRLIALEETLIEPLELPGVLIVGGHSCSCTQDAYPCAWECTSSAL